MSSEGPFSTPGNPDFATTQWRIVQGVADSDSGVRRSALATLCEKYWYPLYAFVRRKGHDSNSAADVTQAFFADLFERGDLERVNSNAGKFRSFLLAAIGNFLKNEWKKQKAAKRGGGHAHLSIDYAVADQKFSSEPGDDETAEKRFEREWALALIDRVYGRLEKEFVEKGKKHLFETLRGHLAGKNVDATLAESAAKLGITEVAAKVSVHRMRSRFGDLLRLEIGNTVDSEDEIDAEIRHLFSVLKS